MSEKYQDDFVLIEYLKQKVILTYNRKIISHFINYIQCFDNMAILKKKNKYLRFKAEIYTFTN